MLSVLEPLRIAANISTLTSVIIGTDGSYFDALNQIQDRFQIETGGADSPYLLTDLDDQTKIFLNRILAESQVPANKVERLSPACEYNLRARIAESYRVLQVYDPSLPTSVRNLIGTLIVAQVPNCVSGSSPDALGTVWISPRPDWDATRYAECLCHELVHQALFLEDMLNPIFQFTESEPMIVSSIRRRKRPYESSFHAAVVSGALIEMYLSMDFHTQAVSFLDGLVESVVEFRALPEYLTPRGVTLLAELELIAYSCERLRNA
jgi:hypothetical protein